MRSILAGRVRCLYCGASSPFWECNCVPAQEIREGKRRKPVPRVNPLGAGLTYSYDPDIRHLGPDSRMLKPGEAPDVTPRRDEFDNIGQKSVTEAAKPRDDVTKPAVVTHSDARKRELARLRQRLHRERRK